MNCRPERSVRSDVTILAWVNRSESAAMSAPGLKKLVMPLAFLIVLIMYRKQKAVFTELGLKVRQNLLGLFAYMLLYQALTSPICVIGYCQELLGVMEKLTLRREPSR